MGMKEVAEKYSDYQVEMRRWFHNNAEVSEKEYETAKKIREELDKMGVEWEHCGLETSTLATIKGAKPGKTVLLRGDIDALSVTEETGLPFASKTKGVMHACGHDCHISMLLTAAHILNDMKDELCGTVKLAWQSSEEVATGAKAMVEDGGTLIVGGIYDDRLLVKLTKSAVALMPDADRELPYEGAKEMLLVDNVENKEFLRELLEAMYEELPAPKKKK